jgi:hypothetical protein
MGPLHTVMPVSRSAPSCIAYSIEPVVVGWQWLAVSAFSSRSAAVTLPINGRSGSMS